MKMSVKNARKIWDIAAKLNLLGYLGTGKINEKHLKRLANNVLNYRLNIKQCNILIDCGCGICTYDVYWSQRKNS